MVIEHNGKSVYGIDIPPEGKTIMPEITGRYSQILKSHRDDKIVRDHESKE